MPKPRRALKKSPSPIPPGIPLSPLFPFGTLAQALLLAAVTFLAYLPSFSGEFILDDDYLLTESPLIQAPDGLYRFWCSAESMDYWPVTNTALWIEWRLWGANPAGYHATNLVLHAAAALLIWVILRAWSIPGAFFAALLFAVHPVNVESVAWIAQRKNTLAMVFFLLSALWYLKADGAGKRRVPSYVAGTRRVPSVRGDNPCCDGTRSVPATWYGLSLLAFAMAMLGKGSTAMLPALLLGMVWWRRGVTRWDLLQLAPFFAVAAALTGVNVWFQTHGGEAIRTAGLAERLLGTGGVIWFYLSKALWPFDLVFIYPQWRIQTDHFLWWLPLAAAAAVSAVLWWNRKDWGRPFWLAWGLFSLALAPAMGLVDVGFMRFSLVADRYQHIALLGVVGLAAAGWSVWRRRARGAARWTAGIVALAAVVMLAAKTWQQSELYQNAIRLYQTTLEKNPDCPLLHNNLGCALIRAGRLPEATAHLEQAVKLKPDYAEAYSNLGKALVDAGRAQEAIGHLERAVQLDPEYATARYNLGYALVVVGRPTEAIDCFQQALRIKPDYAAAQNNLGNVLADTGRLPEAIECYERVLKLRPDYAETHNNLGYALFQIGRLPKAIPHYQEAIRLSPDYVKARANLALAYAGLNRPAEALATAQKALAIARATGQTAGAREIEDWINSYRASHPNLPQSLPSPGSAAPPP